MNKLVEINRIAKRLKNELVWDVKPAWCQLISLASKLASNQNQMDRLFSTQKQEWKNFILNSNAIQTQTDSSFLIKQPNSDWCFWLSRKCVRFSGKNGYRMEIGIKSDMNIFRAKKGTKTVKDQILGEELWGILADKEKNRKVEYNDDENEEEEVEVELTPEEIKIKEENHLKSMAAFEAVAKMKKGVKVSHPKFGVGIIKKTVGDRLTIEFADGDKVLMRGFVELV